MIVLFEVKQKIRAELILASQCLILFSIYGKQWNAEMQKN